MKRAVILQGTGNQQDSFWYPWLVRLLKDSGYEVYHPQLPDNRMPDKNKYDKFLRESGWDFADNLVIGFSSGATATLNLLSAGWCPHVKSVVLISAFLNERLVKTASWYTPGQFDNLFMPSYDTRRIKSKADNFYFVHSDDDPNCDIDDAKELCNQLGGDFTIVHKGHHLGEEYGHAELPELETVLRKSGLL